MHLLITLNQSLLLLLIFLIKELLKGEYKYYCKHQFIFRAVVSLQLRLDFNKVRS